MGKCDFPSPPKDALRAESGLEILGRWLQTSLNVTQFTLFIAIGFWAIIWQPDELEGISLSKANLIGIVCILLGSMKIREFFNHRRERKKEKGKKE